MTPTTTFRLQSKASPERIEEMKGKLLHEDEIDVMLRGPSLVRQPDGKLLAIYLPGILNTGPNGETDFLESFRPILHDLRKLPTTNRGMASGTPRLKRSADQTRTETMPIASSIIGSFEAAPPKLYCRLTAWSGKEWSKYTSLFPLFRQISALFREHVPDRWAVQMGEVAKLHPDWQIPGTAFTTISVNNSYATGVHTDSGDLDSGFSTLAVLRKGDYRGGWLSFPEYRVAVDFQQGDLMLMDAHQWHGNTPLICNVCGEPIGGTAFHDACGVERISVVSFFRTKMVSCGSAEEEAAKAVAWGEKKIDMHDPFADRTVEEMAAEALVAPK